MKQPHKAHSKTNKKEKKIPAFVKELDVSQISKNINQAYESPEEVFGDLESMSFEDIEKEHEIIDEYTGEIIDTEVTQEPVMRRWDSE